ncbi:MAG: sporulation protein YqfD [Clostridiales bacterium]|uniref:sporulation protein YqfD n=1 Tax=Clostridium sp. N3C TaxID=1776758 RepID=UPI00092E058B|nr:sporulation protein YqfD [Clostridium sp. N3C]NLZ48415.1 sporulation protein YqfD [Clostridiales bacterium]SCN21787.1 sporulation protein YqfD [Clostridium sp. N3C]
MSLGKYASGVVKIKIQAIAPERIINLFWKSDIKVRNITRIDISTIIMDIDWKDYNKIKELCSKTDARVTVLGRKGVLFYLLLVKRHLSLIGGCVFFVAVMLFLSTFIWSIEIESDKYLSPYEIRQKLYSYGIKPGILKSKIDVKALEDKMLKDSDNIMYFRARIEGATLKIAVGERVEPPQIEEAKESGDIVAAMDGQVIEIFSTAGTPVVEPGDIVKKGQVLIKGEQGKEGATYPVHAEGKVIAKTFHEYEKEMQISGQRSEPTGNTIKNAYIEVLGKKIYLKKSLNKFTNYDRILDDKGHIKYEIYNEIKTIYFNLDPQELADKTSEEFLKKTMESFDKSAKLIDKTVDKEVNEEYLKLRMVFVVEMDIAKEQSVE